MYYEGTLQLDLNCRYSLYCLETVFQKAKLQIKEKYVIAEKTQKMDLIPVQRQPSRKTSDFSWKHTPKERQRPFVHSMIGWIICAEIGPGSYFYSLVERHGGE